MDGEPCRNVAPDLAEHRTQLGWRERVLPDEVGSGDLDATTDVDRGRVETRLHRSESSITPCEEFRWT
jgi:hypothetical protein